MYLWYTTHDMMGLMVELWYNVSESGGKAKMQVSQSDMLTHKLNERTKHLNRKIWNYYSYSTPCNALAYHQISFPPYQAKTEYEWFAHDKALKEWRGVLLGASGWNKEQTGLKKSSKEVY